MSNRTGVTHSTLIRSERVTPIQKRDQLIKTTLYFTLTLLAWTMLAFVTNSHSAEVERPVVRVIYFIPNDVQPQPNIDEQIDTQVKRVKTLFADLMEAHGFNTKGSVLRFYYGSPHDRGTPGYRHGKPLPVELSQFSAKFVKDEVIINWTTESELDNAGFNIYRSTSQTKDFHRINTKLIQGAGTTGERNTYQFIDKTAKPDVAYYYRIEDVDLLGTRRILKTYQLRGVIAPIDKHITTRGTQK